MFMFSSLFLTVYLLVLLIFFFFSSFLIPGVVFTTTTSFPFSYINSYREYTAADAKLEKVNMGPPSSLPCAQTRWY